MTYRKRLFTVVQLQCVKYFLKSSLATQGVACMHSKHWHHWMLLEMYNLRVQPRATESACAFINKTF